MFREFAQSVRAAILGAALCLFASGALAGGDAGEPTNSIDIDGVSIAYRASFDGAPLVVFDSGLAEGLDTWDSVFPEVAKFSAALAYSRPGLGDSGPSSSEQDGVRTSEETARGLKRLLGELGAPAPYILVGHSLGGLNVLKYAELYPEDVAAIVLVDSRPRNFRSLCEENGAATCSKSRTPPADWPLAARAEVAGVPQSEETAPTAQQLGALPVTVITSTRPWPGEEGAKAHALWVDAQKRFAEALENGRFVRAEGAGHYIHVEQPQLVIDEIRLIKARVKNDGQ